MTITLGETILVHGQQRFTGSDAGKAVGPANLQLSLAPGVVLREYIGADRVHGEHIKCDHGTVSFGTERIFATPAAALAYMQGDFIDEASEGALKFGDSTVFSDAVVSNRSAAVVGCAVAITYTIEG